MAIPLPTDHRRVRCYEAIKLVLVKDGLPFSTELDRGRSSEEVDGTGVEMVAERG